MRKNILKALTLLILLFQTGYAAQDETKPVVWGTPVSPYVRKVLSVLEEKGVPYDDKPIFPKLLLEATKQKVPEEFQKASPLGKIPAFQLGAFSVSDSSVIAEYIEKKWPEHPVYPKNPEEFAMSLWYEKYADTVLTEVFHKLFFEIFVKPNVLRLESDTTLVGQLKEKLPEVFEYLEKALSSGKTDYLVGNTLTIADISIIHHFVSLQLANVPVDLVKYPLLQKYIERVLQHPSIKNVVRKI